MANYDTTESDDVPPKTNNSLDNVKNVLGFLLAGFGAVLSFLGLRSSEVTTVLRNDSLQASLIALILLLGILAAVSAVATDSESAVSVPSAAAIGVILFGASALVIFAIPIEAKLFSLSGTISLAVGCVLVLAGIVELARYRPFWISRGANWKDKSVADSHMASGGTGRGSKPGSDSAGTGSPGEGGTSVHLIDVLILASVMLIAIAAYGAMRLETRSQLSFSAQVGASFSMDGSLPTVSVDIAATKIAQSDWVYVDVYALPIGINTAGACKKVPVPRNSAPCVTDPCFYFNSSHYADLHLKQCDVLLNGSVVPNATGNVNETLTAPFSPGKYQDIDVRASVCSVQQVCEGNPTGQNSRFDYAIPNSSPGPSAAR